MSSPTPQSDPFYMRLLKTLGPFILPLCGLAGGYSIAQKITSQPALQIVITIAATVLAWALSFVSKVWQKLEGPLVDKAALWVPSFLKNSFAGHRRQYLNYLCRVHRVLEFSGLMQRPTYHRALERIFIEPSMTAIPPHLASAHLIKRPQQASASDTHDIWHLLRGASGQPQGIAPTMVTIPLGRLMRTIVGAIPCGCPEPDAAILVILGGAGSGKTTLLKYITFSLSQPRLRTRLLRRHRLPQALPVLLYVRDHLAIVKDKATCTLPELVQAYVQDQAHLSIPVEWFEQQFKQGKCLVMLDGLDETTDDETRQHIVQWIQAQMLSYPKNRFLLTARPHGYMNTPLDDALVLHVQPFSPSQIRNFIKQWFLIDELMRSEKNDTGAQLRAAESAGNLLARLNQKASLLELAANPLLLTMIATLASNGGTLPHDRQELYREILQVLLYRRRNAIGLTPKLTMQQKLAVLQPLALHMMQKRLLDLEYDRLCQIITPHLAQITATLTAQEFLERAKALAYDRVRARDQREPLDEILELEHELNTMQAPDINPLLAYGLSVHPLAFNRSSSNMASEAVKIDTPLVLNSLNVLNQRTTFPYTEEEQHLRWLTSYWSQVHARRTYFAAQHAVAHPQQSSLLRQYQQEKSLREQQFAFYRRLCIDFALLELRKREKLPAWETIMLLKEKQEI